MRSSPFYMEAISRRSGNPPHGSVGMVQIHTVYAVKMKPKQSRRKANEWGGLE